MENPYQSPESFSELDQPVIPGSRVYGGIRRLPYFGAAVGLWMVQTIVWALVFWIGINPSPQAVIVIFAALFLMPVYARLKNIGTSGKWCLVVFVPLLNLILLLTCLVCPEGFADTRQFDTTGKVLAVLATVLFGLLVFTICGGLVLG